MCHSGRVRGEGATRGQYRREENEEGRNGKQQCGNMSFPAEETKGKHRRN